MKMLRIFSIVGVSALLLLYSCNRVSKEEKMLNLISEQESENGTKDSMYSLYLSFANSFPQNSQSSEFLYKTADYYKMTKPLESAEMFKNYFERYPDSPMAANSLFNAAFMLENTDSELSIELYKKFINKYPEDERVESAKDNLKFVGKPGEYIMEQLKQSGLTEEENDSLESVIK